MSIPTPSDFQSTQAPLAGAPIANLLNSLGEATAASSGAAVTLPDPDSKCENHLAMVRLGIASALFYALRSKHPATAAHSLRVALSISTWAERLRLPSDQRDRLEVAALLHDVGKIGIPDMILRKPGKLSVNEQLTMDLVPKVSCEILSGCTADAELLTMVRYANHWYQCRRHDEGPNGDELPLGSRMLAIVGAFDAMTTDQIYRPAMSRDRAVGELCSGSGTQFDPELVHDFCRMLEAHAGIYQNQVLERWLGQLAQERQDGRWIAGGRMLQSQGDPIANQSSNDYLVELFTSVTAGVVFLNAQGEIVAWNDAISKLTSISADAVVGTRWSAEDIGLFDESNRLLNDANCPLCNCLRTGNRHYPTILILSPQGQRIPVRLQVSPVMNEFAEIQGAVAIFNDLSRQVVLEERLIDLHNKATKDSLTGVENRGQFDQSLKTLVDLSAQGGPTFSLVICDVDHFKQVNDVHGHQAGDEALVKFADLLRKNARSHDLVCRYGGEEFCLLAPGTDNATATKRAEAIRAAVAAAPIKALGGKSVTASFGVTEYQAGDSAETILARADRALLRAKDSGRNRVIQLGSGRLDKSTDPIPARKRWASWLPWSVDTEQSIREVRLVSPGPTDLTIEKFRGFVADHNAEVVAVGEQQVTVRLAVSYHEGGRRTADHNVQCEMQLSFTEQTLNGADDNKPRIGQNTLMHVKIRLIRNRDRRSKAGRICTNRIIASLRSYLMATLAT